MPGVVGLQYTENSEYNVNPIILSDSSTTWIKTNLANIDSGIIRYNPKNDKKPGSIPVVLALTRNFNRHQQKILIVGDADFMNNTELLRGNLRNIANQRFTTDIFRWFSDDRFPIDIEKIKPKDTTVTISRKGLFILNIVFLWCLTAFGADWRSYLINRPCKTMRQLYFC